VTHQSKVEEKKTRIGKMKADSKTANKSEARLTDPRRGRSWRMEEQRDQLNAEIHLSLRADSRALLDLKTTDVKNTHLFFYWRCAICVRG
jgi:hypothetical protein